MAGKIPVYDAIYAYKRPMDGRVVWIHALGHVVKDASGKPTDMFGVTQDITDFKLLETELVGARQKAEEATQMKSMFLANMSHEIRTPMNAIIGLSHLALKTPLDAKQRDYISKVHNAGTSLLAIINDILDFSKIEAGKLDIETTDFQLDEVISSVTTSPPRKRTTRDSSSWLTCPGVPEQLLGDPLPPRPDSHELRQQRGQVHRARRDPAQHRTGRTNGREGAAQVLRARHGNRHDVRERAAARAWAKCFSPGATDNSMVIETSIVTANPKMGDGWPFRNSRIAPGAADQPFAFAAWFRAKNSPHPALSPIGWWRGFFSAKGPLTLPLALLGTNKLRP